MIKPKSKGPGGKPSQKTGQKSGKHRDNAVTYNLKKGSNVVYKGITNNPKRRENEHKNEGKNFTKLEPTSHKMLRENAKKKEAQDLAQYRNTHGGRNPKYNKDGDG